MRQKSKQDRRPDGSLNRVAFGPDHVHRLCCGLGLVWLLGLTIGHKLVEESVGTLWLFGCKTVGG